MCDKGEGKNMVISEKWLCCYMRVSGKDGGGVDGGGGG